MTYLDICRHIKDISLSNGANTVTFGDVNMVWNTSEIDYSAVNCALENIECEPGSSVVRNNIILYYADRLMQDNSNADAIYSDGFLCLSSIVSAINGMEGILNVDSIGQYTPFSQKFSDYLAGVWVRLTIATDNINANCYEE